MYHSALGMERQHNVPMKEIFRAYNDAWEAGQVKKPLVVLIGGNMGTGKSTFAKKIEGQINHMNGVSSGVIRSIMQAYLSSEDNPFLFGHTYQLDKVRPDLSLTAEENAIRGFQEQAKIVGRAIANLIRFSESEGQQYIIDGNHILPTFTVQQAANGNIISLFFHVSDFQKYRKMVSGPTHWRDLTLEQMSITKCIHDFIVEQAEIHQQPIFDYDQHDEALNYVARKLEGLLRT